MGCKYKHSIHLPDSVLEPFYLFFFFWSFFLLIFQTQTTIMGRSFVALPFIIYLSLTPSYSAPQLDPIDAEKTESVEEAKEAERANIEAKDAKLREEAKKSEDARQNFAK